MKFLFIELVVKILFAMVVVHGDNTPATKLYQHDMIFVIILND